MRFLRHEHHKIVPWKNGAGVTRELALHEDEALHSDFLWRISIATVDRDGPFSTFSSIDRTIAVLRGEGMILESPSQRVTMSSGGAPFCFDGETPIVAIIINGETTDLNAMTRRGFFTHSMDRLTFSHTVAIDGESDETVVVFNSSIRAKTAQGHFNARPFDVILGIGRHERIYLFPDDQAEVYIIRLSKTE
ncbi:HutD family protein [Brucella sp. BE17]|uniref:HutD/Ves family protein n=1 Tax=Brucella sp. BE17 TaxID=3142977 RepID=UPI0031BAA319